MIRTCAYCGKEFKAINNQQVFCSHLCGKRNLNNLNRIKRIHKLNKSQSKIEDKIDLNLDKKKQTALLHQKCNE